MLSAAGKFSEEGRGRKSSKEGEKGNNRFIKVLWYVGHDWLYQEESYFLHFNRMIVLVMTMMLIMVADIY